MVPFIIDDKIIADIPKQLKILQNDLLVMSPFSMVLISFVYIVIFPISLVFEFSWLVYHVHVADLGHGYCVLICILSDFYFLLV